MKVLPMKNRFSLLLIMMLAAFLFGCGSEEKNGSSEVEFRFAPETRQKILKFRATLRPGDVANVSLTYGYGNIAFMADEGQKVASGDLILKIDMKSFEDRVRRSDRNISSQLDLFEKVRSANPAEMKDLQLNLRSRQLEFERAQFDRKWLYNPKTEDEIWKIKADLESAQMGFNLAEKLHELKKNIADKGFESSFNLRSSEIDKKSREIELDYARRMLEQLKQPPLPEELAQIEYQKAVASGEIWLAENRVVSASITARIREKNLEVVLERYRSSYREYKKSLDEAIKYAPRDGIIVHPRLWGDFKFRVGQHAWSGVSIIQVIVDGKYFLDSLLKESQVFGLKEKASATIILDSMPEAVFPGEIKSIGKAPKPMRGARNSGLKFIPVEVAMNASQSLLFGDKAEVAVNLGSQTGVFVPRDFVETVDGKSFLHVKSTFSGQRVEAELEDFDQDWLLWKNPPQERGALLFP